MTTHTRTAPAIADPEAARAAQLGIPEEAQQVLVLAESSHWDPNWMLTSEQYFRFGVRRTLDRVLDELDRNPRRVWSADCTFFLAMYWERRPAHRDRLAAAIERGQLRLTTSGVTTQDTLLPTTESILRDFLVGQEWLRSRGLDHEPRLAYFPDSFGHAPSLPSLLRAAGFDQAIVTRIDGSAFVGSDWEPTSHFPRPGSSAEALSDLGSADFVWRDRFGAEVLAHWHPFTYGQGDMVAAIGPLRYMSLPTWVPDRSPRRVAARFERHAAKLATLARTRYLLCPIGLDFVDPIPDLIGLVDRYNEHEYPRSGLWVVNAGSDDYLALVDQHRDDLPVVELDPNPYWTGFYASRPDLKRSHRSLVDALVLAEADAVAAGPERAAEAREALEGPWWTAATGNHHDYVTGTAPDRVVRAEQQPWLDAAHAQVHRFTRPAPRAPEPEPAGNPVEHGWDGGVLRVRAGGLTATIDPSAGGCLTDVGVGGRSVGPVGADLVAHEDGGGLWRMGGEYWGGRFAEVDRASHHRAQVRVEATEDGGLVVLVDGQLDGAEVRRSYRFDPDARSIRVGTTCAAGERRTVTLQLQAPGPIGALHMDQPGGTVTRPTHRHFDPTFWPVSTWLATDPGAAAPGIAIAPDMVRAVSAAPSGQLHVVVARNAPKEVAWGILPIPACPARGHEPGQTTASVEVWWPTDARPASLARDRMALEPDGSRRQLRATAAELVELVAADDDPDGAFEVLALKPAHRGEGTIVRFIDWGHRAGRQVVVRWAGPLSAAWQCDARERDLAPLAPSAIGHGTEVVVEPTGAITTLRLLA